MARSKAKDGRMKDRQQRGEEYFIDLAYRKRGRQRFTQDSPILPDVFVHYGTRPKKDRRLDLLLTPDWSKTPGEVATELEVWIDAPDEGSGSEAPEESPQIAYNQSVVAVRLTFEELVCSVLPMSWWWQNRLIAVDGLDPVRASTDPKLKSVVRSELLTGLDLEIHGAEAHPRDNRHRIIRQDFIWAARLFWVVQHSNRPGLTDEPDDDKRRIADYFLDRLMPKVAACRKQAKRKAKASGEAPKASPRDPWVYSINRNRPIQATMLDSLATTKADAAIRTFDVRGEGISWAIIDTGIDARHPAFRRLRRDGLPHERPFGDRESENRTRIRATYDFSHIRKQLSQDQRLALKSGRLIDWEALEKRLETGLEEYLEKHSEEQLEIHLERHPENRPLRIPHTERRYRTPRQSHGTHVAGILGADWRPDPDAIDPLGPPPSKRRVTRPLQGLCPAIELYDLRVFKDDGTGDEFAVMSALQFVRSLNQRHDALEVHGVNLSLAMEHEVSNYACGRSPVCEECTRLVGNGVVVVAAAGNQGRSIYTTVQNQRQEGFRIVSIADPGNTEAVITVGSTHRREPHTYGVSYFSSRGPTGDGRAKPDLVAPGEKIESTVPGERKERKDGTSQAAPHVSGAAALLMSRHREVIGEPARVKQVLMGSATDLGREKHFQGAGLVDVMRALQSL